MGERNTDPLPPAVETEPPTRAWAPTPNRTCHLSGLRVPPNRRSHAGRGRCLLFVDTKMNFLYELKTNDFVKSVYNNKVTYKVSCKFSNFKLLSQLLAGFYRGRETGKRCH